MRAPGSGIDRDQRIDQRVRHERNLYAQLVLDLGAVRPLARAAAAGDDEGREVGGHSYHRGRHEGVVVVDAAVRVGDLVHKAF